ncbi:hypothetical protein SAY87_030120 [Trapa incisa]|uniref:Uncharacterized protein n=1 Tax=Trapa incisa TaxID=236973 RepID=A0AAN7K8U2_9MYRT|nr:hypothetical protein SAY87_030120 [Trapa incisa]
MLFPASFPLSIKVRYRNGWERCSATQLQTCWMSCSGGKKLQNGNLAVFSRLNWSSNFPRLISTIIFLVHCSKQLIKRVQCRHKLLKNKRYSILRQVREDVAQLIWTDYEEITIDRHYAQQLFKDESTMALYGLLDHFCEFNIIHLSYIRRHRYFISSQRPMCIIDCPKDINEAVSSLVFASPRCWDRPELRAIQERYGHGFIKGALDLHPGSLISDKLSITSVPDDVMLRLVGDISRYYCLQPEILTPEYVP